VAFRANGELVELALSDRPRLKLTDRFFFGWARSLQRCSEKDAATQPPAAKGCMCVNHPVKTVIGVAGGSCHPRHKASEQHIWQTTVGYSGYSVILQRATT
jgi:hypothetical protein